MTTAYSDRNDFMAGKNINGYYTYHLFINFAFWLPIYAVFFLNRGLDYSAILLLYVFVNGFQTLFEMPSGILADRWGRKRVLMLGALFQAAGYLLIAFGHSMYYYIPGMSLIGIALAFTSGTDAAFIYDSLVAADRKSEFKQIEGRAYMLNLVGWGAGGLLGGFIAEQSLTMPYILSAVTSIMALFVLGICEEPPRILHVQSIKGLCADALSIVKTNRRVQRIIILSAVIYGLLLVCHKFSQPFLLKADISLKFFGIIYFVWLIGAALSSNYSERIERLIGRRTFFILLPLLAGGSILYLGWLQNIAGVLIALFYQFAWGALRPQMNQVINDEVTSSLRATLLSTAGFGSSIVYIVVAPFMGTFADRYGFENSLLVLGALILAAGIATAIRFLAHDENG